MTKNEHQATWEGDIYKDTVTYRFIELASFAIEMALHQDEELEEKYKLWLAGIIDKENQEEESKPIIWYDYALENEAEAQIFAMPNEGEFFISFKTKEFETSISMSYDIKHMDVQVARVVGFAGDMLYAISWAEAQRAQWDDLLVSLMQ